MLLGQRNWHVWAEAVLEQQDPRQIRQTHQKRRNRAYPQEQNLKRLTIDKRQDKHKKE